MTSKTNTIMQLGLALAVACLAATGARGGGPGGSTPQAPDDLDVWCTTFGSFNPNGSTENPFQSLMSAISRTKTWDESNEVVIWTTDQAFGETMRIDLPADTIIDTPCTIMKTDGNLSADVLIGRQSAHYDVKFLTVNTHLFGDGSDGGVACTCLSTWMDEARAIDIAMVTMASGTYDVICYQEVWDQEYRDVLVTLGDQLGYGFCFYGDEIEGGACLHSGLLVMSKHAIVGAQQYIYTDENGYDKGSTKGFLRVDVNLPNPAPIITVYNTHTNAGHDGDDIEDRFAQMNQLGATMSSRRVEHPDRPVFIMGDFNIASFSSDCGTSPCWEYPQHMRPTMLSYCMLDGQPNAPDFFDPTTHPPYTLLTVAASPNPLAVYFNPGSPSECLDYVLYAGRPLSDAEPWTIRPDSARVLPLIGSGHAGNGEPDPFRCFAEWLSTDHLSDHYAIEAAFSIYVDE